MIRLLIILLFISPAFAEVKPAMTSFNAGVLSPLLRMRSDFAKYDNGCATLQNMLVLSQGPVMRRPGTYYIAEAADPNVKARFIPFEYSKTDTYAMEFGHNTIRFFRSVDGVGTQILDDDDAIYELTTVYEEDELPNIQYVQLSDVMYLVSGTDPPQKLSRLGHSHWTIADVNYVDGPFLEEYLAADSIVGNAEDYASDKFPSTARELASTKGTASGAVANTNDNDDASYRKRQAYNNIHIWGNVYWAETYFTIEIPFNSTADNIQQVVYKIGWYNSNENITHRVSCKLHYATADTWIEISTDTDEYVEIGGDWDDVNGVKLYVYNLSSRSSSTNTAGAYIYEIEAWGLQDSDTKSINYIKSSNTQTYDRFLDASGAADQGGSPNIVRIPSTAHGFLAGDYVTLSGTANYDGTYPITNINDADTFDIAIAFNAETFATTDTAISRALIYTMEDTFAPGHIGALWEIRHPRDDATLSGTLNNDESSSAIACEGDYKLTTHGTWTATVALERSNDSGTNWETVSRSLRSSVNDDNIDFPDNEPDAGYNYRVTMSDFTSGAATFTFVVYDHMHTGVVKITDYIDANDVTAEIIKTLDSVNKTTYHSEGYWSDKNGWPRTIEFHEFRIWYGGSNYYPQTIWASRTDDFENMKLGTFASHAMTLMLAGQNPIQWLLSHTYLMIGTLGGAGRMGDPDEEMTPLTKPTYRHQTTDGSAYIQAVLAGDAILYVERGGRRVREFVYAFEKDKFVSPDMTVLAEHITGDGINGIAFQSRPEKILWSYRDDGNFLSMSYNREQDVIAWSEHITDGDVESMTVIPGALEDELWMIVERIVDSNTVRYVERMKPHDWGSDDNDTFFVDSGLTFDGGDSVVITGATKANPCVITVSTWPAEGDGTDLSDDDQIKIVSVSGMTELNGNIYTLDDADTSAKTFSLNNSANTANIDSSSYTTYTSGGTAQRFENSFAGFDHLEGETVAILGDGAVQTSQAVSSGGFSISNWVNKMHAGLPYTSILETMPITFVGQKGSVAADKKQISLVAINFFESLGTKYGVEDDTDDVFTETSLFTGWKKRSFQHGFRTPDTTIYIEQVKPLPLTIRAIVPTVTVTE